MEIYVKISFNSIYSLISLLIFSHHFIIYIDFTHTPFSNTASDDIAN